VNVHLVTIEISIVWSTDALIEAQCFVWHNTRSVSHDGDSMETRLSIEQHCVTIVDVSLNSVTKLEFIGHLDPVGVLERDLNLSTIRLLALHKVSAWVLVGALTHKVSQLFDVVPVDSVWERQHLRHKRWHDNFIDGAVGVRGDDCASREIDTLATQVLSESPVLAFDSLT
jgi:hypothetical protein